MGWKKKLSIFFHSHTYWFSYEKFNLHWTISAENSSKIGPHIQYSEHTSYGEKRKCYTFRWITLYNFILWAYSLFLFSPIFSFFIKCEIFLFNEGKKRGRKIFAYSKFKGQIKISSTFEKSWKRRGKKSKNREKKKIQTRG